MFAKLANCKCYVQTAKPERRTYIPNNSHIKVLEDPKVFRTFGGSSLSWKGKNLPSLLSLVSNLDLYAFVEQSKCLSELRLNLSTSLSYKKPICLVKNFSTTTTDCEIQCCKLLFFNKHLSFVSLQFVSFCHTLKHSLMF